MNKGYEDTSRNRPKWPFIIIIIILLRNQSKRFTEFLDLHYGQLHTCNIHSEGKCCITTERIAG